MLTAWIYDHPPWMVAALCVGAGMVLAWGALLGIWRLVPHQVRTEHNDLIGFTLAIVGVVYAVLLAFIAVVVWEDFSKAGDIVENEVSHLANLYADVSALHGDGISQLRDGLERYVKIVIDEEWPMQRRAEVPSGSYRKGWYVLREADALLLSFKPADLGESNVHRAALEELNALLTARRSRIVVAAGHVSGLVWWIIVLGGGLTVFYTLLFGMPSLAMHMTITAGVAISLALVIVLIVEMDYPFRGDLSIGVEPYQRVLYQMRTNS